MKKSIDRSSPQIPCHESPLFHRVDNGDQYVKNQRRDKRVHVSDPLGFNRINENITYHTHLKDVSKNGMSMLSEWPYLPGTQLLVHDTNQTEELLMAKVVWSRRDKSFTHTKPKYIVGLSFSH